MERFTSFFELHIGFPSDESVQSKVREFLNRMRSKDSRDWNRSVVRAVHVTNPGCFDPHNVPGTLGSLVSRKIYQHGGTWEDTINRTIVPACTRALEELSLLDLRDARLEIEFPFACREASFVGKDIARSSWSEDPISIGASKLGFPFGVPLDDVPKWEIHFLLEQIPGIEVPRPFSISEVGQFLSNYGVEAEQTIEYQSQSMLDEGREDFRLIATAYYQSPMNTTQEAERLFYGSALCEDAARRGYNTRFILEHIVTCFRPKCLSTPLSEVESRDEISCAP